MLKVHNQVAQIVRGTIGSGPNRLFYETIANVRF